MCVYIKIVITFSLLGRIFRIVWLTWGYENYNSLLICGLYSSHYYKFTFIALKSVN